MERSRLKEGHVHPEREISELRVVGVRSVGNDTERSRWKRGTEKCIKNTS